MARRFGSGRLIIVSFLILLAIALLLRARDYTNEALELDKLILAVIQKSGVNEKDLAYERKERFISGRHLFLKIEKHYTVGRDFDTDDMLGEIEEFLKRSKFTLAKSVFENNGKEESFLIALSLKDRILYRLKFLKRSYRHAAIPEAKNVKIAVIVDDFGYNTNNLDALFEITTPLTISVLPNLPYSESIAERAGKHNIEVILHLPLEPYGEKSNLERGTIMVDMPPQEVNDLLTKAMKSVPGLKGVSNHMGSRATEDRDFMKGIFRELKKRDLYFFDNLVTDKSVCKEVAEEVGLRLAERSVFLDNESHESYIERQLRRTARLAEKTGWAIGVGHDRSSTIRVLTKVIPQLEEAGYEFVYVSELVKD
jgi:polysaccharide deacetylase 2 family uncharacterized protein YibQ